MSRNVNKVLLIGNIGRDPDVQTTTSGKKVAYVSLATSRRIPRDDGEYERTEWHRLTLWDRPLPHLCRVLPCFHHDPILSRVGVSGKLGAVHYRVFWEGRLDALQRYVESAPATAGR